MAGPPRRLPPAGVPRDPGEPGGETSQPRSPREEIPGARAFDGVGAVLFDLDGTLVDSPYDWPAIRRRLGVDHPSLIDGLNGLPSAEREARWRELEAIEAEATREATLKAGARELLERLRRAGLGLALVTNNGRANTRTLLDRFGLAFDVVITRESGLYKPSPAPLLEAARRLGVDPSRCAVVGDSRHDLAAARGAGCYPVILVGNRDPGLTAGADLAFADLEELLRFVERSVTLLPPQEG